MVVHLDGPRTEAVRSKQRRALGDRWAVQDSGTRSADVSTRPYHLTFDDDRSCTGDGAIEMSEVVDLQLTQDVECSAAGIDQETANGVCAIHIHGIGRTLGVDHDIV